MAYLSYNHVKAGKLPANPILPAFFLIVPISCLFGLSAYRVAGFLQPQVATDLPGSTSVLITASYALAVVWGVGAVYLIRDYFTSYFVKSPFAPPQWGFV